MHMLQSLFYLTTALGLSVLWVAYATHNIYATYDNFVPRADILPEVFPQWIYDLN